MRSARATGLTTLLAVACASLGVAIPAAVTSGASAVSPASHRELVFLRDQGQGATAARDAQSRAAALAVRLGSTVLARSLVPNTLTVRATDAQAARLAQSPLVRAVVRDARIPGPPHASSARGAGERPVAPGAAPLAVTPRAGASCGTPAHPQLNPEALGSVDAPGAWARGATGKGVKVAFLADGLDVTNPDLQRGAAYASGGSPAGSPVIVDYQDFSSDGTASQTGGAEAFGDAASIAAQGNTAYDLSAYVGTAHPLPKHCDVKIVGTAPGASLLALKVFAENNSTTGSAFVQAISYAVAHGARVINESFGANLQADTAADIIKSANDAAVAAGVLVVVSSGDAGVNNSLGSPSTDPSVLSVGATTTFRAYQQSTYGAINAPGASGAYLNNNISSLSSGGIAQNGTTVDLVAPGDLGWSLCSDDEVAYAECSGQALQDFGGTSQSAPLTSGAAADVIQAYAATHHGALPSPALITRILVSTAKDVYAPADQQGAGLLQIGAAVAMARSIKGTVAAPTPALLASVTQANLSGMPRQTVTKHLSLTNNGTTPLVVSLRSRGLVPAGAVAGHVTLNPSVGTPQPKLRIGSGALEVYQKAVFTVPAAIDRVRYTIAWRQQNQTSIPHVALFDPTGAYAGYSLPQGNGGFADVEVARPRPGKWTAVVFTVWNGWGSGNVGTSGSLPWSAQLQRFAPVGTVTPGTVTLPGGRSTGVALRVALPSTPGDAAIAITVTSGPTETVARQSTTIPVTLRTKIPVGPSGGVFHGVITGGNGRAGAPGQLNSYDFSVPAGKKDLDVSVAMATNPAGGLLPGSQAVGLLIDPSGQVAAYDSNWTLDASGITPVVTRFLNLYRANPAAGQWRLAIEWYQPIAGTRTSISFNGAVRFNQVAVLSTVPHSASAIVSKSSGATFQVQVDNEGLAPLLVSPDPRTTDYQVIDLPDMFATALTQDMPNAANGWFVPTETKSIHVQVDSSVPVNFDANSLTGDPDLSPSVAAPYLSGSLSATGANLTYGPPTGVTPGIWLTFPSLVGPYGPSMATPVAETTTFSVQTLGFDDAVSSSVPDSVYGLAFRQAIDPDYVAPGATDIMTILISPTASVGSVVTGTLFINSLSPGTVFQNTLQFSTTYTDELAAIPYQYQVGP